MWEKQRKIKTDEFVLLPGIKFQQKENCVLEGKDIELEVFADEDCFMDSVGEYTNKTIINIGPSNIEIVEDQIIEKQNTVSIYIDKLGICKDFDVTPSVWGVRVKKQEEELWEKTNTINFDPENTNRTQCALVSTGGNKVYVNGKRYELKKGITEVRWTEYISQYVRKNELIITDEISKYKQAFVCMPKYSVHNLKVGEEAVLSIKYVGPIYENLKIRYFIDGLLEKSFMRETTKNSFLLHVLLGKANNLIGKRIAVDIASSDSFLPISIVDDIIVPELIVKEPEVPIKAQNTDKSEPSNKNTVIQCADLVDIDKLAQYIFTKSKQATSITSDVKSLVKKYWEVKE